MIFLLQSAVVLGICLLVAYIFVRGLLGVMYELASLIVRILNGPDNEGENK